MRKQFEGRVALITGAGKGLGRAYAHWLAARGASVLVNNRRHAGQPWSARQVAEQIQLSGGQARALEGSVEVPAEAAAMVERAYDIHGRLDILICNAGIGTGATFHKADLEEFRHMMDVNFFGAVYPLRAALPRMRAAKYGRIVLTTSASAYCGSWGLASYGAAKAAIVGLARTLALENQDKNVRVNVISPYAHTPMTHSFTKPELHDRLAPSRVAPVVGWLCSENCAANGAVIEAGAGSIRRVVFGVAKAQPLSEDLDGQWQQLQDLEGTCEIVAVTPALRGLLKGSSH
jgi:NAD(P)-dependent dehydrogenase (short-subunit alcohol dehydrogenase family)